MDCSICSSIPLLLRPPRNTICGACYEGAKSVITLMNKLEADHKSPDNNMKSNTSSSASPSSNSTSSCKPQPLAHVPKWMNNMKDMEDELNDKISFLSSGLLALFREEILTDIQLRPGTNNSPSIPAHKALLAARSEIFKNMLDSDACKAPAKETITLTELNQEELESLLEFLYSGSLPTEKLEKHVYSLTLAADKYDIPYLLKFCERHMLRSLDSSNALDVLEISEVCSNKILKETSLSFIVRNMEEIVFSPRYEAFVPKNPHLAMQITRAFLIDVKSRK